MKKTLFLINLVSGKRGGVGIDEIIVSHLKGILTPSLYDIAFTEPDSAKQIRDMSSHYETVVGVGGDGTLHHVVRGIADMEYKPKVGIIPTGTGNDLARSLGILNLSRTRGLPGLLEAIVRGNTQPVDIISINDDAFCINYFGIGNDAKISHRFNQYRSCSSSGMRGSLFRKEALYVMFSLNSGFYQMPFDVELRFRKNSSSDETLKVLPGACGILLSNVRTYAGGAILSSKCRMDDGMFEVTVVKSRWEWLLLHLSRFLKRPLDTYCSQLTQFQTDVLEILFAGDSFCQVDGEVYKFRPGDIKHLKLKAAMNIEMVVP